MPLITKGVNVRVYPTEEQKEQIEVNINCRRAVYNQYVAETKQAIDDGTPTTIKQRNDRLVPLKNEKPWLKEADSTALQQALRDFNTALKRHKDKPKKYGFPNFNSKKYSKWSYRTPYNNGAADVLDIHHIKLPKIGVVATKRLNLPKEYKLLSITIEKTRTLKYYAKLCIECEIESLPKTSKQAGFDLGLTDLLISSDGNKIKPPKFAREGSKELAKAQRKLSKMRIKLEKAGKDLSTCKNYQKQLKKVAKINEHIRNQRKDFNHKLSKWLVENYDLLAFEDLNVKNMIKNHKLAFAIADVSWSQLLRFIEYKCDWYGKTFVQVPRNFASSKICSECGCYHADIVNSLAVREWVCPDCRAHHDRDVNAAVNILMKALEILEALNAA